MDGFHPDGLRFMYPIQWGVSPELGKTKSLHRSPTRYPVLERDTITDIAILRCYYILCNMKLEQFLCDILTYVQKLYVENTPVLLCRYVWRSRLYILLLGNPESRGYYVHVKPWIDGCWTDLYGVNIYNRMEYTLLARRTDYATILLIVVEF